MSPPPQSPSPAPRKVWVWRGLALLAVLLLAFLIAKESREPHLWLFADDLLHPKPLPHTIPLSNGLALRLYTAPQPHVGKIARLQKGLVLMVDGRERIEEGFGFGLPLVEIDGQAYLSRSASVERRGNTLVKHYQMDTLDTPSGFLRRKYEPVPPIGSVVVSYTTTGEQIAIAVDFTGLNRPWDKAYLMNEQGARFFTRYEEPGLAVKGEELGRWQPTTNQQGCMITADHSVRFCVETQEEVQRYYGRERYWQYYWLGVYALSWAGIDLELEAPLSQFEYGISVQRQERE